MEKFVAIDVIKFDDKMKPKKKKKEVTEELTEVAKEPQVDNDARYKLLLERIKD